MKEDMLRLNLLDLLKREHQEVAILFDQIDTAASAATRAQLFGIVKQKLELHSEAEERCVYPQLETMSETEPLADEAIQEHSEIKDCLDDLVHVDAESNDWRIKFNALKGAVQHHVHEEENEIFPMMRRIFSEPELEAMKHRFLQAKDDFAHPVAA